MMTSSVQTYSSSNSYLCTTATKANKMGVCDDVSSTCKTMSKNVKNICGRCGADFEGEAIVRRGNSNNILGLDLPFWLKPKLSTRKDYIVIKGPYIFVYDTSIAPEPRFAIPLRRHFKIESSIHRKKKSQTVSLKTGFGDVKYKFKFNLNDGKKELGNQFCRTLKRQINVGTSESTKLRLGHCLGSRSESLIFAKAVVDEKEQDQPMKDNFSFDVDSLEQNMMKGWSY